MTIHENFEIPNQHYKKTTKKTEIELMKKTVESINLYLVSIKYSQVRKAHYQIIYHIKV